MLATRVLVVTVTGDCDLCAAAALRARFPSLLDGQEPGVLLIDLAAVTFLDAAGARALLWMGHTALSRGHEWGMISGGNRWVHRVLDLLQWTAGLPLYPDWISAHSALCLDPEDGPEQEIHTHDLEG